MTLTIDIGNTTTNCGLFDGEKIVLQVRLTTNRNASSDEIGIFLRSSLRENGFDWKNVEKIGICSVVPSVNYSWSSRGGQPPLSLSRAALRKLDAAVLPGGK